MLAGESEIRKIHGISREQEQRMMDFLQGAVYCRCKNRKNEWFAARDNTGNIQFNTIKKIILLTTLCLSLATGTAFAQQYGGGSGMESDPFLISSRAHMEELARTVNGGVTYEDCYFKLTVDLTGITTVIGGNSYPFFFSGNFDGDGHTIGLNISTAGDYAGVFGRLYGATVKNTKVSGKVVSSSSSDYAGGICGCADKSTISNCNNTGSISSAGNSPTGGICGIGGYGTIIINCYNTGSISSAEAAGGICGWADKSTIINCYNTGNIYSSAIFAGGICGFGDYGTIINCYNTGSISASAVITAAAGAGGICGWSLFGTIINCYNTGNIYSFSSSTTADAYAGGICGACGYGDIINNCFAANATITASQGSNYTGRIIGDNQGRISNCHALISMKLNGQERRNTNADSKDGADGEYADFKNESWLTSVLEWDFGTVWMISGSSGWPVLKLTGNISLEVAPSTLYFTASGETNPVTITSNVSWTAGKNVEWITVTPSSGSNNGAISVTAEANMETSQRTGVVTVSGGGIVRSITVTQAADGTTVQNYGGGNGTKNAPFLISSRTHMEEMATIVNNGTTYEGCHFKLTADLTGITTIIGNSTRTFRGIFDGDGHTVELNINTDGDCAGVFGRLYDATVKNTNVSGRIVVSSSSYSRAGGICGSAENNSIISNCYNTGSISMSSSSSYSRAGGICGSASNRTIIRFCYNTGNITTTSSSGAYAGGICGYDSSVSNCYNTGNISSSCAGGICGYYGVINDCYNMGSISAASSFSYAGGICGYGYYFISNCFAANATITATNSSQAGRIGSYDQEGYILNCHALISMKINDQERRSVNAGSKDGADGEEADFKNESWLTSVLEWDFETVWTISGSSGWPVLKGLDEPAENISLEIAPSTLDFTATGETKTVTITSNVSWTVDKDVEWITVTPESGSDNGTISVTAAANMETSQRTGTVTVSGGGIDQIVSITQVAYVPSTNTLAVSPATLDFTASGETQPVTITSNVSWTADGDVEWVTVTPSSGSNDDAISVTAAANTTTSQRTGFVVVTGGGIMRVITVTQAADGATLTVSTSTLDFTASGETQSVTITSNVNWIAGRDAAWITVSPSSGSNDGVISVTTTANTTTGQRTGTVTVTGGGITRTIVITQAAVGTTPPPPTLTVSATNIEFVGEGGLLYITIHSNTSWTAVSSDAWAIVLPASGTNDGTVSITAAANSTENARTATVTISGGGLTHTVTVTQEPDRVDNAPVGVTDVRYFNSRLYVNTPVAERVAVYSLEGMMMYQSQKQPGIATFDLRSLPRGVLIVRGDSGWVRKIVR